VRAGARRDRLEAKLFGGASMFDRLRNIGAENAAFAKRFLQAEGIVVIGGDTGGTSARRIRYRPTTGQAMQKGIGWRKALRAAIADNPFIKGEGLSPRARRELLGHSQLTLSL
jgi:chemotaxis receptor (MCP) glutamine deamidase CheD